MNKKELGKRLKSIISIILTLSMIITFIIPSISYATQKKTSEDENIEIMVGETTQLKVSNKNVTWKSSDESIATVSKEGKVTGIKPGNVVITAKTKWPILNKLNKGTTTFNVIVKSSENKDEISDESEEIKLSANKTEYSLNEDGAIFFYAEINSNVDNVKSVSLIDAETKDTLLELVDDGNYSQTGDDLPGDNIYTGKTKLDTSVEKEYGFYAVVSGSKVINSNTVKIVVISSFTDQQLADMDKVDKMFEDELFSLENYSSMTVEERKKIADSLFEEMITDKLIESDSLLYDDEEQTYTFVYSAKVLGALAIKDWNPELNGSEEVTSDKESTEGKVRKKTKSVNKNAISYYANNNGSSTVGKALILWSFNQGWDDPDFRKPFYQTTESDWDSKGLDTTVNYESTVEDYKNLKNYDVIIFSGHGIYYTYKAGILGLNKTTVSSLLLTEKQSTSKDFTYWKDLKKFRIGKYTTEYGTTYAILPKFFNYYYNEGDLYGSVVFAENCEFYGKNGNVDNTMASAVLSTSAESVIGFHNSVMADYSRELMKDYVDQLILGSTNKDAYDDSISKHGKDDYFTGREAYGPTAYPIFTGNKSFSLINTEIENGDFEKASIPVGWNCLGDTRVISKLGSIDAYEGQKMAILTTGIGSGQIDYLSTSMKQKIRVPANKTSLVFDYDFVSEEPMEYLGKGYNDTFAVNIISDTGTETILKDDIDSATWYPISGINFDGGDDTTYHTNWKEIKCDLSKYAGQAIEIQFMVYDVGDSSYDSAILLDAVSLK